MQTISSFMERLRNAQLTKKELLVAEYILHHFSQVCHMSTSELGRALSVSDATVIRASRKLGFDSFLNLQQEIWDGLMENSLYAERVHSDPVNRLRAHLTQDTSTVSSLDQMMKVVQSNLQSIRDKNAPEKLQLAAEMLIRGNHRYIIGQRPTAAPACHFAFYLRMILPEVQEIVDRTAQERLLDACEEDCALVIDFSPFSKQIEQTVNILHSKGTHIILLTNHASSPFAASAELTLLVDVSSINYFNSQVAVYFLLEYLLSCIADMMGPAAAKRLDELAPFFAKNHVDTLSEPGLPFPEGSN